MSKERILVVDDQPINVQLLKRKLERGGLDVSTANNGLEALEQVKAHKPDLILLDLMMPGGLDGLATLEQLKQRAADVPVVMMSGKANLADADGAIVVTDGGDETVELANVPSLPLAIVGVGAPPDSWNDIGIGAVTAPAY